MELGTFGLMPSLGLGWSTIAGQKVITVSRYLLGSQAVSLRLLVRTAEVIGLCTLGDHGQKSKDHRLLETGVWRHQCDILGKNKGIAVHVIDTKSILGTTLITDPAVHPWWTVCCPNGGASSFA